MEQRLQKIIADAGITSRRKAEQIILEGRVSVNGTPVSKLGSKADLDKDHVRVDGRLLAATTDYIYLLINKPVGFVSTVKDPEGRPTVISLVKGVKQRVYPVGRLDFHSSGLMILTNDGELANFLMSRASAIPRSYQVKLEGRPDPEGIEKLRTGIVLDGRRTEPCEIRALGQDEKPWFEITLIEGRYHQVRRMFERVGKGVVKLKRVGIAFLTDKGLLPGKARHLTGSEVERLKAWKPSDTARLKGREVIGRSQEATARSKETSARSPESGVRSRETTARSKESEVRSQESGVRRNEPGVRNNETRGWSRDSGIRNRETFARNKESGVRSKEPDFRNRETGAQRNDSGFRSRETFARNKESGSRSKGTDFRNRETGAKGNDFGFRKKETGPRNTQSGGSSQGRGVRNNQTGARSQSSGARRNEPGGRNKGTGAGTKRTGVKPPKWGRS